MVHFEGKLTGVVLCLSHEYRTAVHWPADMVLRAGLRLASECALAAIRGAAGDMCAYTD